VQLLNDFSALKTQRSDVIVQKIVVSTGSILLQIAKIVNLEHKETLNIHKIEASTALLKTT
jgi:hypothetical protein